MTVSPTSNEASAPMQRDTDPLVTVFVPSYNHGRYIGQTIDAIARQTYRPIELIVIDDGSRDDSPARLKELATTTDMRLVLKSRNAGVVKALNEGLELARGKYFAPCASDDWWHPEKIAEQVQRFESDPDLKIAFTEGVEVDEAATSSAPSATPGSIASAGHSRTCS